MSKEKLSSKVWQDPIYFIAFGFGSGLIPKAPGTWGTIAAIPVYLIIAQSSWWAYLGFCLVAFFLGVIVSSHVSSALGVHDHPGIVWDEIVGYLLTMFLVPFKWYWLLAGFIFFRLFDIWKPQPIRWVDNKIKGGVGIMLDDVIAAAMAWIVLQALVWGLS